MPELRTIQLTEKGVKDWWSRVTSARQKRDKEAEKWDILVDEYKPHVEESGRPENVKANIHFRNVESKKPQLFFQSPKMRLKPRERMNAPIVDPQTGQPMQSQDGEPIKGASAITIHEQVLDYYLGVDEVNLAHLMDRLLFDCLCPSGFMVSKIGYRAYTSVIQEPVMQMVPQTMNPFEAALGAAMGMPMPPPVEEPVIDEETGEPEMRDVPVIVKEEYFWERVSPNKVLVPHDYHDTDFENAPWLGIETLMLLRDAKRQFNLPDDFEPKKTKNDENLLGTRDDQESKDDMVEVVEVFYKAYLFQDEVHHPDVYHQLVLIKSANKGKVPEDVVHRLSPYQEIDPTTGRLTTASMRGNPIHVGTIRDLSDSAYVPSDCAMTNSEVKEINTYRRQTVKLRDANIVRFLYDVDKLTPNAVAALKSGDIGQYIAVEAGALSNEGRDIIAQVTQGSQSRVDLQGAFEMNLDVEKALALSPNQVGSQSDRSTTATEVSTAQANANVRLSKERNRVLNYVIVGVRKFDSLLQMFADDDEVIEIVGDDGVARLATWNKQTIAGRFAYDIVPDSQLMVDMATERAQTMQMYNLMANDPFVNRKEVSSQVVRMFNFDPGKTIQQPPPEPPTEPKVNFAFKGEDFIGPQAPIVLEIMQRSGIEVSEQAMQLASSNAIRAQADALMAPGQPGVDGAAEKAQTVDKSQGERTAQLEGGGSGTGRAI